MNEMKKEFFEKVLKEGKRQLKFYPKNEDIYILENNQSCEWNWDNIPKEELINFSYENLEIKAKDLGDMFSILITNKLKKSCYSLRFRKLTSKKTDFEIAKAKDNAIKEEKKQKQKKEKEERQGKIKKWIDEKGSPLLRKRFYNKFSFKKMFRNEFIADALKEIKKDDFLIEVITKSSDGLIEYSEPSEKEIDFFNKVKEIVEKNPDLEGSEMELYIHKYYEIPYIVISPKIFCI